MKKFSFLCLIISGWFNVTAQNVDLAKPQMLNIRLLEKSEITVLIETNVNSFSCAFTQSEQFNKLRFSGEVKSNEVYFRDAILNLPVSEFECGKEMLNKDFREFLKESEYPDITIEFKSGKWYDKETREANSKAGKEIGLLEVLLTVSGVSRKEELGIYTADLLDHVLSCTGKIEINIHEFGLDPPQKFMGLVKVKETINIHFDLDVEHK